MPLICKRVLPTIKTARIHRGWMSTLGRTINLAERKTCERPIVVQKLVSADVTKPCPHSEDAIPSAYKPIRVVPVRICRREDLQRSCRVKLCDCPQKLAPKTFKQILCGWAIFGAKGALAGGLLYWTISEGIWGDSTDTEDFYFRIRDTIGSDPDLEELSLPHLEYIKFKIVESYNRAVMITIGTLVGVPMRLYKIVYDALFPCAPFPEEETEKCSLE